MSALFGRRSRRFGWGMEIPAGPMAYKSPLPPTPLDEFERSIVIAAGLGVSGWHHGIPYSGAQEGLCSYSVRYTGRTFPVAAGIGNTDMFYTQDDGDLARIFWSSFKVINKLNTGEPNHAFETI